MKNRFQDKKVIVTGAAQGMGYTISERFAREGAQVVMFDHEGDTLAAAVQRLQDTGLTVLPYTGDVSLRESAREAVRLCIDSFGGLDVMIVHAGIADAQPFLEVEDCNWARVLDVNLNGAFYCTQEAAREMKPRGGGAIVMTASTNAFWAESNMVQYNVSKAGIVALMQSAALDLAPFGIRVNAVSPGIIRTRLASFVTDIPENAANQLSKIPLGRFGEPADIAGGLLYLSSDEAAWVTGHNFVIDGGMTAGVNIPLPDEPLPGLS
jgi:NAD(P)-dependent dehydrogenase (short-subunit alcohol dehydrogenase family)